MYGVNVSFAPSGDKLNKLLLVSTGQVVPPTHDPDNVTPHVPAVIASALVVF
jgi:hypothetical protein